MFMNRLHICMSKHTQKYISFKINNKNEKYDKIIHGEILWKWNSIDCLFLNDKCLIKATRVCLLFLRSLCIDSVLFNAIKEKNYKNPLKHSIGYCKIQNNFPLLGWKKNKELLNNGSEKEVNHSQFLGIVLEWCSWEIRYLEIFFQILSFPQKRNSNFYWSFGYNSFISSLNIETSLMNCPCRHSRKRKSSKNIFCWASKFKGWTALWIFLTKLKY